MFSLFVSSRVWLFGHLAYLHDPFRTRLSYSTVESSQSSVLSFTVPKKLYIIENNNKMILISRIPPEYQSYAVTYHLKHPLQIE